MSADAPRNHKKANSYYYWHGHEKERAAVGDVAPMPVPVLVKKEDAISAAPVLLQTVKKYSWTDDDNGKTVSVYVQCVEKEGEALDEASVSVSFDEKSVTVSLVAVVETTGQRTERQLKLPLAKRVNVAACTYKVKAAKHEIYLKLVKTREGKWFDLIRKSNTADSDEEDVVAEEQA